MQQLKHRSIPKRLIVLILIELISSLLIIPLRPALIVSSLISLGIFSYLNYWLYRLPFKPVIIPEQKSH
jgi:uncharacterized membrane protein